LLFREDVVKTFSGETLRQLRVLSLLAVGILVWALVFAGCSGSNTITITLSPASGVSLNPGATVTITATLTNDTNNQGVTWTLSGPGQLSSNTTTSVVYTAPAIISTATTATVTATSVANSTITTTETITLNAVLTIATTSLPAGTLQTAYNTFVDAEGATGTFTWSVTAGSLPPGLTFQTTSTSTSAEITGTPTVLGTYNFTVQVTDSSGNTVTQALSIRINPAPPLAVATGSLPNGTVGTTYNEITLQASSGTPPYTWSLINGTAPPPGLTIASTGAISGTPIASGTFSFEVQVVDSSTPQQSASANLSITVNPGNTDNARLSGYYAFSVRGFDAPPNGLFVAAGSFFADGNGNLSSGIMDINDTLSDPSNPSFTGTYYVLPSGLGYMTFNISSGGSRSFAFSVTTHGNANIIEFDDSNGGGTLNSGVLLQQTTTPPFSNSSVMGNYAFGFLGVDSGKNRYGFAGYFSADGNGNFTAGLLDSDDSSSGVSSSIPFVSGTYSVASNGRGTANIKTTQGTTGYSFYIVNSNELLFVETDTFTSGGFPLVSGTALGQSSVSLDATAVFEVTGLDPTGSVAQGQVGLFNATAGATYTLTSDQNSGGTLTAPSGSGGYTVDSTTGRVGFTGGSTGFQNSQPVLYLVTPNEAFIIGTDTSVSFGFMTAQQTGATLSGTYAGGSLPPVDPSVSNVVSIGVAGTNTLNLMQDISSSNGLSFAQSSDATAPTVNNPARVEVTQTGNQTEILYLVSSTEFFALDAPSPADGDTTARVDIFQQ